MSETVPASEVRLSIPVDLAREAIGLRAESAEARMGAVLRWVDANIERGGGPFAAGVFDLDDGRCVSVGVNRVVACACSVAHAEMMALMLAQQTQGVYSLALRGRFVLTSSAQPCAQCFGAIPWSGVRALEFGADRADVEAIGFDEGPCPADWREALESRGIRVTGPLLRAQAAAQLRRYQERGGPVYNG